MSRVAIVGSGMVGANIALDLVRLGHEVVVFEKGPQYPYPHVQQMNERLHYDYVNPKWMIASDLRQYSMTGDYTRDLSDEAVMLVGGAATHWTGLTMRMSPRDFRTRSQLGFGTDWPLGYDELEPWYCAAEARIGVSGTDADNPWAPPRSKPYPLPPFELTYDDRVLAGRLEKAGIHIHTTPQARTREPYGVRPACMNYGACETCPIGARYSPTVHLNEALASGRCTLRHDVSVRRIVTDGSGRARTLLCRETRGHADFEFPADLILVAGGAFESARLLLLSRDARNPDGLGNGSGHVGRHLVFHHIWAGHMHYKDRLYPGRAGYWTGQSEQFCNPPTRGRHGGVKVEFPSSPMPVHEHEAEEASSLQESLTALEVARRCRRVAIHAETAPSDTKYVALSAGVKDRFGDPRMDIHYGLDPFDHETYAFGLDVYRKIAAGTGAEWFEYRDVGDFGTFAHFMGTCRMSASASDGVTDTFGAVHGTKGLYVIGLANFASAGGALNPTITGLALALRASGRIHEELAG